MPDKFCPKCGNKLPDGAEFCPKCGTKVKEVVITPSRTEKFPVTEVILSEMLANVRVVTKAVSAVSVTIEGDEETKQAAKLEVSGQSLKISAPLPFYDGERLAGFGSGSSFVSGSIFMSGSMSGMSIINGQVVNGRPVDMKRIIHVIVEVPLGTTVKVGKLIGQATIGDIEGDLVINANGSTTVKAGKVKNLSISISGSADVDITSVNGTVEAQVSGSGDVRILGGEAKAFNATVSGSGDITFNGVAETANMGASGSGDIYLAECLSTPNKRESGNGEVRVGRAPTPKAGKGFSDW
jgi:hypothetical protein